MTNTVHPPAGATALLAATSPDVTSLGWWLVAFVLLGASLMLASACVINNIQRQFPIYWWTPEPAKHENNVEPDIEKSEDDQKHITVREPVIRSSLQKAQPSFESSHEIKINVDRVLLPSWLEVDSWERSVLEILRLRIAEGVTEASSVDSFSHREQSM